MERRAVTDILQGGHVSAPPILGGKNDGQARFSRMFSGYSAAAERRLAWLRFWLAKSQFTSFSRKIPT
jgi:hypothetical protein